MNEKELASDLEYARRDMLKGRCVGGCGNHEGDILVVRVTKDNHDWGYFAYCEAAIAEDKTRGLTVTPCAT